MRILMVTFDFQTEMGGMEGRAIAYTKRLLAKGIHVELAALAKGQKESQGPFLGTRMVRLSSSTPRLPSSILALVSMMRDSSLDCVFMLSGGSTVLGNLILGFSRLTRRRSGVFFYGKDILHSRRRVARRMTLVMSILLADRVATNSRYTASILPIRPRRAPVIVYPGVEKDIAAGTTGSLRDPSHPRILFVGRLVSRKGVDLLLRAFSELHLEFPGARLDIVGDGPEMNSLRSLTGTLGLADVVSFHGALYGPKLWARYAEASLFVMPSRQSPDDVEGFGTVFLEAGVFGVPSVGTRTGGIPEAVADGITGTLIDDDDTVGLRKEISSLLEDPVRRMQLGSNAREHVADFTWESSTNGVLQLLRD